MVRACLLATIALALAVGCKKKEEESSGGGSPSTQASKPREEETPKDKGDKGKPKDKVPPKAKAEEKFAGLNEWAQAGDVRVRVTKAKVQRVPMASRGKKYVTEMPYLMLWVEVENLSMTKKISYSRWDNSISEVAPELDKNKVRDEHGNNYHISKHDGLLTGEPEGSVEFGHVELRPGDPPVSDILCVERPVEATTELKITLRAVQTQQAETYNFRFPASAWK